MPCRGLKQNRLMTVFNNRSQPRPLTFSCGAPTFTRLGETSSGLSMSHPCSEFLSPGVCRKGWGGRAMVWRGGGPRPRQRGNWDRVGWGKVPECQQPWIVGWGCVVQRFRAQTQTLFLQIHSPRSIPSSSGVTWLESSGRCCHGRCYGRVAPVFFQQQQEISR